MADNFFQPVEAIEILERDLALADSNIYRVENPRNMAVAIYPNVPSYTPGSVAARAAEDAWEARSLAMHAAQETVVPAPKPFESGLTRARELRRGN